MVFPRLCFFLMALHFFSSPFMASDVVIKPDSVLCQIKPMNAVNNGPVRAMKSQTRDNFESYKALKFPYARNHDASFCWNYGGEHANDISAIFPDFSKDPQAPASYDFTLTDEYLKDIRAAGTEPFFRLGQKIEHSSKKYGIMPPADFNKWAIVCEHIIRHYNEGWADGYHWNIQYWEIWNEPDLDSGDELWKIDPRTWGGDAEEFYMLYEITSKHLKKCFPDLKIGGPAVAGFQGWIERFIKRMSENKAPLDFFSWHCYTAKPSDMAVFARKYRQKLDRYGFNDTESILNEWNYVKGWTNEYPNTVETINNVKGAAFTAAAMSECQAAPVDMLMYYDARNGTVFNGLWDFYNFSPKSCYYVFYAWSKLLAAGTQVKALTDEGDLQVTAAKRTDGKILALVSRYNDDDNVHVMKKVRIHLPGLSDGTDIVIGHITDSSRRYTEIPVNVTDGAAEVSLEPNSFVMLEFSL